ncbi:hypothetical protein D7030_04845 [Flavobacteriaceae bacterium AU392]|nr:hypothetical protein D1817_11320 [Flavobacteriaceae bacterium]RKM86003.1 hypothetical protein D7030_04845 [Flavobacteriaceae bacterium AU392]
MENKITKKQLNDFFKASLNDKEEGVIKEIIKNDNTLPYKKLETYRDIKLDDKMSFFEGVQKQSNYKTSIYYMSAIAASIVLFVVIGFLFKKDTDNNLMANWDTYTTIEKLRSLNQINIESNAILEPLQLVSFYENETNVNVKLQILDCLKQIDSKEIDFNKLLKKETIPMAQLALANLKN